MRTTGKSFTKVQNKEMTFSDDTAAMKALKNSDKKAFKWIYEKYIRLLRAYVAIRVGDIETSEDIVHDVFEKLWKERETIRITYSLSAFLHACVRNKCGDNIDHNKVKIEHAQSILDNIETFPILDNDDPLSILKAKETERRINDVIDNLSEQCRDVFLMWWKEGLKYGEIATKIGISTEAVGVQINRARNKLRKSLLGSFKNS